MKRLFMPWFFLLTAYGTQAQHHAFFDHVWQQEGLSQSQVLCLTQDSDGFVWIGTQDGLNRYDGSTMKTLRFEPFNKSSLSDDYIWNIQSDNDSLLWIISEGKVDVLNFCTQKIAHINFGDTSIIRTWCIGHKIYAATSKGVGEIIRTKNNGRLRKIEFEKPARPKFDFQVHSICTDPLGNLLAATSYGLFILPKGTNTFIPYSSHYVLNNIFSRPVRTLFVHNNSLFFSSRNRFYIFNTVSGKTDSLTMGPPQQGLITCSGIDNTEQVWIGTNGNGLFCLSPKGESWTVQHFTDNQTSFGLTCNYITTIHCSNYNQYHQVWIGTRDKGLYMYSRYKNIFKLHSALTNQPQGNFFGVVKDRNGNVWAGTQDGIYRIALRNGRSEYIDLSRLVKTERNTFESIFCDRKDDIWVGNGDNLYRVDKTNNRLTPVWENISSIPFNHILRVAEYDSTTLFLGARHGYALYNLQTKKGIFIDSIVVGKEKQKMVSVGAFANDKNGNVWMGTVSGLIYLNKKTHVYSIYKYDPADRNSLLTSWILDVRQHPNGRLYVSTSKGMSSTDPDKFPAQFEHYNLSDGLKSRFIYGMTIDHDGKIWTTTNSGISVFNPTEKTFRTYHSYQGVQFTEFNSGGFSQSADGELLFAGIGGVIGVYPDLLKEKAPAAKVYLQSVKLNGNPINLVNHSSWSYSENDFEFTFSVLDYYSAGDVELKYRLNGKRDEWISIDNSRTLTLANLAPGNYKLEVIGVNADGLASQRSLTYVFTIRHPFWNTAWFYGLLVLAFLLVVYVLYRLRLQSKLRLYREVEKAREQEGEKSRKAAALDLHDEFGNGLTRISMLTELVKNKTPETLSEQRQLLHVISEHSQRLYQGTKDFIWSIHPGNDNVFETVIRIKDHADELFYDSGLKFSVNGLQESMRKYKLTPSASRNLAMIFQEALYNIVKHAHAQNVWLSVTEKNNGLCISLKDDGKGFEMKNHTNSFGLINMKQRTHRIGGEFELHSSMNNGSEIRVLIPLEL